MDEAEPILVVEDDRELARVVGDFLEREGYAVRVAHTGVEALGVLRDTPVSLLVVGLPLPDMPGLDVVAAAAGKAGRPDVLVTATEPTVESLLAAMDTGAAGYLVKPFALSRLGELVAGALERRTLLRENERLSAQLADRLVEAEALLAIASTIGSTLDLAEALRRVCRELVRLTGADAAVACLPDPGRRLLVPAEAYGVPAEHRAALAAAALSLGDQGLPALLRATRRPAYSDEVARDPRLGPELFPRVPHQSAVVLPLVFDEELAGVLYLLWWKARRVPDARELGLLEQLGGQVGLVLRNARLFDRAEQDRRRLGTLHELASRLAGVHDTEQVLALIVEEATRLLGAAGAGIRLLEGSDDLVLGARTDSLEGVMGRGRVKVGGSLSGRVVASGQPLAVEDLAEDTIADPAYRRLALERGLHGFLAVPLRAHGRTIGVLSVFTSGRRRFDGEEISLLTAFADHASLAIEKGRLLREADEGRRLLARLCEVALAMQTSWEREERLRVFVRSAHDVLGFDRVNVFLPTADGAGLGLATALGEEGPLPPPLPLTAAAGVYYHAFRGRRAYAVLTDEELARVPPMEAALAAHPMFRTRRFVVAPLVVGDRVVGVVSADNKRSRRLIPPTALEPFRLLCQQLAMALEEARLYAEARAREEEAETQRTRLALIFDSTSDGIVLLGLDGRIEAANERAGELLGLDARAAGASLVDGLVRRARTPAAGADIRAAFGSLLARPEAGGGGDVEVIGPPRRVLQWVAQATRGPDGATIGLTLTFRDVTEEREVSQMKSDFVSFVTHQLRTPLAGIKWLLELAGQAVELPDGVRSYIEDAREANERLIRLVNDLLNVSRLESGKMAVAPRPTDLAALTAGVVAELDGLRRERGHRVSVEAAPLPRVLVDPQLMRQVVLNVLSNAIKYTKPGGRILIRIERDGEHARWTIQDSGIGIPKEAQRRLFEKFYRAENALTVETEGTGLGLYLVRLIVEQCGGRIWCESEEGVGSTFVVTLPLGGGA